MGAIAADRYGMSALVISLAFSANAWSTSRRLASRSSALRRWLPHSPGLCGDLDPGRPVGGAVDRALCLGWRVLDSGARLVHPARRAGRFPTERAGDAQPPWPSDRRSARSSPVRWSPAVGTRRVGRRRAAGGGGRPARRRRLVVRVRAEAWSAASRLRHSAECAGVVAELGHHDLDLGWCGRRGEFVEPVLRPGPEWFADVGESPAQDDAFGSKIMTRLARPTATCQQSNRDAQATCRLGSAPRRP